MAKQAKNENGNPVGLRMLTIRDAKCYRFSGRGRVILVKIILPIGTPVLRKETRWGKNGHRKMQLVKTGFIESAAKRRLWVCSEDLRNI